MPDDYFIKLKGEIAYFIDREIIRKESEEIKYVMSPRGHYWRPLVTLATSDAFGVESRIAMPYAVAVECAHRAALIFDDLPCMDNSSIRHGQPTCHIKFGEANAILCANEISTGMIHNMIYNGPAVEKNSLINHELYNDIPSAMVLGQKMDLYETQCVDLEKLLEMYKLKTGKLFSGAAVIGGILGDASQIQLSHLRQIGINAGIAYQLKDDLYDAGYLKEKQNKPKRQDIHKKTPIDLVGAQAVVGLVDSYKSRIKEDLEKLERPTRNFPHLEELIEEMLEVD